MSKSVINTMIIGKSGAGKSSLINYIFDKEAFKTGSGKPVTGQDFQEALINYNQFLDYKIIDSWGLEANKADDWKKLILNKMKPYSQNQSYNHHELIHSVIYCIPFTSSRIEEFEIELIKTVLEQNVNVIVAFTQSDVKDYDLKKVTYRDVISKRLGSYKSSLTFIDTCSVSIKKIGQTTASETFGKDEILLAISNDIWSNLSSLYINSWKEKARGHIQKYYIEMKESIYNFKANANDNNIFKFKSTVSQEIVNKMEKEFKLTCNTIEESLVASLSDCYDYYFALFQGTINYENNRSFKASFNFSSIETYDDIYGKLALITMKLIPVLNIITIALEKSILKDYLNEGLEKIISEFNEVLAKSYFEIYELFVNEKGREFNDVNEQYYLPMAVK